MANSTTATPSGERTVSIFKDGEWTTKTIVANNIGELRQTLNIPAHVTVNVQDVLYTDNSATMPANETNDDGSVRALCLTWQANNKTGGA
jgi:hypothetical protein